MSESIEKNFEIKNHTTFKIGGSIDEVFFPENIEEFSRIIEKYPDIRVFGNLSDTLISSGGYNGKIILTSKMNRITIEDTKVTAECGVLGPKLSQEVCKAGLSGLEFMIGFPGSVGGEVCMNASANGQAISDCITSVTCYLKDFGLITFPKEKMDFEYRTSRCSKGNLIVLKAEFNLTPKDPQEIKTKMDENLQFRKDHQPTLAMPNCGSIFKNPPTDSAGRLLESVGAKEVNVGGARVWRNHSNFIINTGNASSLDVLTLMYELQQRVKKTYNIILEPEIKFLGGKNKKENELWKKLTQK